jgi:hypothetical protein
MLLQASIVLSTFRSGKLLLVLQDSGQSHFFQEALFDPLTLSASHNSLRKSIQGHPNALHIVAIVCLPSWWREAKTFYSSSTLNFTWSKIMTVNFY